MAQGGGRITLQGIEAFVATAAQGSVSAAARALGSSPSAISQQLSGLEAALGAPLLDRTTRPVSLTPAGQIFRRRAHLILAEAEAAREEVAARDLTALTDLRLGMIEDFDADVTPRLLSGMADEMRTCNFLLETGASHHLNAQLEARALDMVVAAETGPTPDWAEAHPVLREPFVAAVPKGALTAGDDPLTQLKALPLIQYTQRHFMGRQIAAHLARQNLTLAHRFELDSYHAILAMVADGAGWTIMTPLGYLRGPRFHDQVEIIPLPFAPLSRIITLTARKGVLQDMPFRVATRLRPLIEDIVVAPATARMPWLAGGLAVL